MAIKTVPEGKAYTVERNGRYLKTLKPGLNMIIPIMDRIGYRVDMRERKVRVSFPDLKTKDNQTLLGDADIFVMVTDAQKLAYDSGDIDEALRLKCEREMKKLVKSMSLADVLSGADSIDDALLSAVKRNEEQWGVQVRYIDVHKIYEST